MELNRQPIEQISPGNGLTVDVIDIWDTIQGEGPFAGTPAVFIRLAGCNLQCTFCDTDYTTERRTLRICQVVQKVEELAKYRRELVVITGGEPLRQHLDLVIDELISHGYKVQIETNGTYPLPYHLVQLVAREKLWVVCSPKVSKIQIKDRDVCAFKYVVENRKVDPSDGLPLTSVGGDNYGRVARPSPTYRGIVYVQPLDVQEEVENRLNIEAAVKSCQEFGHRLCLQVHKIIGVE